MHRLAMVAAVLMVGACGGDTTPGNQDGGTQTDIGGSMGSISFKDGTTMQTSLSVQVTKDSTGIVSATANLGGTGTAAKGVTVQFGPVTTAPVDFPVMHFSNNEILYTDGSGGTVIVAMSGTLHVETYSATGAAGTFSFMGGRGGGSTQVITGTDGVFTITF